jgi:hypothetical protein
VEGDHNLSFKAGNPQSGAKVIARRSAFREIGKAYAMGFYPCGVSAPGTPRNIRRKGRGGPAWPPASMIVADLSFLNPNVFYELGIAHSEEKPVIHIAHRETRLPFDNIGYRAVMFDPFDWNSHVEAKKQIADFARKALAQGSMISNQVTHARGVKKLKASADPQEAIVAKLDEGMARLQEDMAIVKK